MNLIIQEGLEGLDNEETKVTANIARYHRGSLPDETKHEIYKNLTPQQKQHSTIARFDSKACRRF